MRGEETLLRTRGEGAMLGSLHAPANPLSAERNPPLALPAEFGARSSPALTSGAAEGLHGASSATGRARRAGQAGAGAGHGAEGARLTRQLQPRARRAVGAAGTSVPMDPVRRAGSRVSFQANVAGETEDPGLERGAPSPAHR